MCCSTARARADFGLLLPTSLTGRGPAGPVLGVGDPGACRRDFLGFEWPIRLR
jgi:hypothetical protein